MAEQEKVEPKIKDMVDIIMANPGNFDGLHMRLAMAWHEQAELTVNLMDIAEKFVPLSAEVDELCACQGIPERRQEMAKIIFHIKELNDTLEAPMEKLVQILLKDAEEPTLNEDPPPEGAGVPA